MIFDQLMSIKEFECARADDFVFKYKKCCKNIKNYIKKTIVCIFLWMKMPKNTKTCKIKCVNSESMKHGTNV